METVGSKRAFASSGAFADRRQNVTTYGAETGPGTVGKGQVWGSLAWRMAGPAGGDNRMLCSTGFHKAAKKRHYKGRELLGKRSNTED